MKKETAARNLFRSTLSQVHDLVEEKFSPRMGPSNDSGDSSQEESGAPGVAIAIPKNPEPARYAVVLHNDDYTTMEFVIEVLMRHFGKSEDAAVQIMMSVHKQGRGVAGTYSHEIAETKAALVMESAHDRGFPLKATVEEVGV